MKNKRSCRFAGYLLFIATVMGLFSCHSDQPKPGETTKDRTSTAESGTSTLPTNPDIPDSDNRLPNGIVLPEEWPPNNVKAETGGELRANPVSDFCGKRRHTPGSDQHFNRTAAVC